MRIYMAGAISGNLSPMWRRINNILRRGGIPDEDQELREFINEGISCRDGSVDIPLTDYRGGGFPKWKPYILESFFYAEKDEIQKLMPYFGDFLLDSGAFTFMENSKIRADWDEYVERYADFINAYKIEKFFELDIDVVVGYKEVKRLRKKLETLTGKQSIPVWHLSRGKEEFLRMCDEYPYVAIGGIVSGEIKSDRYKYFPWFIDNAHERGAKIHGLGFTNLEGLKKYHFDSVDSTAWTTGNRFGHIYRFNGKTMTKVNKPDGTRVPKEKIRELAVNNFIEWCKFQQYAETHL